MNLTKRQQAEKNAEYLAMRGGDKSKHLRRFKYWSKIQNTHAAKECRLFAKSIAIKNNK